MNSVPRKIPLRGKSPRKCIYSVQAQETARHRAKFGWLPLNDVAAVMKPRCQNPLKFTGVPKLSQSLVGRSSPYCEDMRRRYCCLTSFIPIIGACFICEDIARQSCAIVCRQHFLRKFCVHSCIFSEPRATHFSLHSKFAQGHIMCGNMVDIQSATVDNRRGKEKKRRKKKRG